MEQPISVHHTLSRYPEICAYKAAALVLKPDHPGSKLTLAMAWGVF
jgi:hypothetical protein